MIGRHPAFQAPIERCCQLLGITSLTSFVPSITHIPQEAFLFSFSLHPYSWEKAKHRAREGRARWRLFVDYKIPERNLDYPAFWFYQLQEAVGPHAESARRFWKQGGLDRLLFECRFQTCHRMSLCGGAVLLVVCKEEGC